MSVRLLAVLRRMSPVVLAVRSGAACAGVIALVVAMPPGTWLRPLAAVGLLALAAAPALAPGGPWATLVILVAVAGWLLRTESPSEPVGLARVVALAGLLYLLHALAALGAALPYDVVVAPQVLVRWLWRVLAVLALASTLTGSVLLALRLVAGPPAHVAGTVAGLALAAAGSWWLARRLRETMEV